MTSSIAYLDKMTYNRWIYKQYDEYKRFVNESNLPDFAIDYRLGTRKKPLNYIAKVQFTPNKIVLVVNFAYVKTADFNAVLYHEFTHIYDNYIFQKDGLSNKILYYSEYHATQIELIKRFKLLDQLEKEVKPKELAKDVIEKFADDVIYISKCYVKKINNDRFNLKTAYFYYIGAQDLAARVLGRDISNEIRFAPEKEEDYKKIHNLLKTIKYNEKPSVELINKIYDLY